MERIPDRKFIVATRVSALAKAQTALLCDYLAKRNEGFDYTFLGLTTQGDQKIDIPLKDIGGKAVFVKELQQAILDGSADFAVHSMKDMPIEQAEGLVISGLYSHNHSPNDILVTSYGSWQELPLGSLIGTSSLRRAMQFLKLRPDCRIVPLRGNVVTRLKKLEEGLFAGIILAEAGIQRLDLQIPYQVFSLQEMVPAFNQGILGIESRKNDESVGWVLSTLENESLKIRVEWERALSRLLGASCKSAIGIHAVVESLAPLSVHVFLFAGLNWNLLRARNGRFSDLDAALAWVHEEFECASISWASCQISFT